MKSIKIGTRGSKLALVQAESVAERLRVSNPQISVELIKVTTQGDRDQRTRLEQVQGTGFFVKELEDALLDRRIDMAVHSLKDVPTELPAGLVIAAVPERLDPRDVLVSRGMRLSNLPTGAKVGTGSLRRSLQLNAIRPDVVSASIRGNVDTRVGKVDSGEYDGLITAAAALIRLGLKPRISEYLDVEQFLPAVGQGALAVECRQGDMELVSLLNRLSDVPSYQSVVAERSFLLELGGGCLAPIGALASVSRGVLRIEGMIASPSQKKFVRDGAAGSPEEAADIGKDLARKLLSSGGAAFVDEVRRK